jgi:quercetin dioxygenase-like cupin family protein
VRTFRLPDAVPVPTDPASFTGRVRSRRLASDDTAVSAHVYLVEFDPGARTRWHTHTGPQWLLITEGRVRVQTWGGQAQDVDAGDTVAIPPGEKHWHGAAPGGRGVHLAVNINAATEWLEEVSDDQYDRS